MPDGDAPQIYRDLMRFKPDGLTPNAWALKAGVSRTVWSDMRRHGNPSRRTLEKLLTSAGSSLAEFEALRAAERPQSGSGRVGFADRGGPTWGAAQIPALPLLASAIAGEWGDGAAHVEMTELRPGEIIERISRPISLARDSSAFAFTIVGNSMWPRFRPGRRVAVSPKSAAAIGDDVIVKLRSDGAGGSSVAVLVGELVRKTTDTVDLRQFNPDTVFRVDAASVAAVEKIVGELI
jgi:phage repressor protein C with HTH and peptisase S24 domain